MLYWFDFRLCLTHPCSRARLHDWCVLTPGVFCRASKILISCFSDGQAGDVLTNSLHSSLAPGTRRNRIVFVQCHSHGASGSACPLFLFVWVVPCCWLFLQCWSCLFVSVLRMLLISTAFHAFMKSTPCLAFAIDDMTCLMILAMLRIES